MNRRVSPALTAGLMLALACSTSGEWISGQWTGVLDIPHNGERCKGLTFSDVPDDARVMSVSPYYISVDDRGIAADFWCSDYEIYLSCDSVGGATHHYCVWDNEGGKTDEGADNDTDDDSDILLERAVPSPVFEGEPVKQTWYVCVVDNAAHGMFEGRGRLTEFSLTIRYHTPQPDLYDVGESSRGFSPTTVIAGKPGQHFSVDWTIRNGGDKDAGTFTIGFYASTDTVITDADYLLTSVTIFGVRQGQDCNYGGSTDFPTNIPAGTYYVGIIIDADNEVAESDETNNTAYKSGYQLTVSEPADLCDAGESYRSFNPQTVEQGQPGQAFAIEYSLRNVGGIFSEPCKLKFYASTDTTIDASDYLIGWTSLSTIQAGGWFQSMWMGTFPVSIPGGQYYVGWIIDADNEVFEGDEANNTAYKDGYQLTVLGGGPGPDVEVPDVVGMGQAEAESAIISAGLVVGATSYDCNDAIAEGHVIKQRPTGGTQVPAGSAVDLVVSAGSGVDCLVAHWKLDETGGTIAHDSSGNGNHGSLHGDPIWRPMGGIIDGALEFDGIDDYVDCGNAASLNITEQITVAAWVRTNDAGNGEHNPYVTKGDHSYAIKHFGLNSIEFVIYDGDWRAVHFPVDSSFNGVWHHLAGTYNGSHLNLYIDGKLKATTQYQGSIASSLFNVNLARNSEASHRLYDGFLDDVRIYKYALSAYEIVLLTCADPPAGDLSGDCRVDFADVAIMLSSWLECDLLVPELCWE